MTIKELYPLLSPEGRLALGRRFAMCYRACHHGISPSKVQEDGYEVYTYPMSFVIMKTKGVLKRYKKKYPFALLEKPKRARIKTGFAQLVNPDSTKDEESKNKC